MTTPEAGIILRDARETAGLPQKELARRAGTAQSAISRIECGVVSPTILTLDRLLEPLNLELVLATRHRV